MATLTLKILPSRRKTTGNLIIYICLTFRGERRYITTPIEIEDEYQFDNGRVAYRDDANILNKRLDYLLKMYQARLDNIDEDRFANCTQLREAIEAEEKNKNLTIADLFERRMKNLHAEGRDSYVKMNEYTKQVVMSILGNLKIQYLSRREIALLNTRMKQRGYSDGNIQMRMTHLKAAINEAIEERLVRYEDHPFRGYKMPQSEPRIMDLTREQWLRILHSHPEKRRWIVAKDMFLLSFFLGGINLADLLVADLSQKVLTYSRKKSEAHKKGVKTTSITIQPEAREIIDRYIGSDGRLNLGYAGNYETLRNGIGSALRELGKEVGIRTTFSFYSARKTFAMFAHATHASAEVIEYCIGQTMKSGRPLYNYVRIMLPVADECVRNVIDYALTGAVPNVRFINVW
jgi:integrase